MAWEGGNADTSWMFENIGSSGAGSSGGGGMPIGAFGNLFSSILGGQNQAQAQPPQEQPTVWGLTPEDWRNIQYMTGALGQSALKGTNMEWLGNMGGVTAQMAKNAQVSAKNKEYQQLLQNINNPNVKDVTITEKGDGSKTIKFGGVATDPMQQMLMSQPQATSQQQNKATPISNSLTKDLGPALAQGPSFFAKARQPWWLNPGQQT